ncbi:MFS transporter, putative [Talaromyces stipitatus ATCC 10500]|uniref:MFS transporter, putative n=1 Tax=Talaromyces stipitatus (strain ATCC 10500 / CBS 375.48 / QM 6759 / NRRL 1006) TaxID=441959 RepID=B8MFF5_TALSN|nr:MFS transporter, putative [Talaromyces stipitatus ATCC 10500]EED16689.1 MFS transporter, putative [Talaromyces stipitatus ATCC 10500]
MLREGPKLPVKQITILAICRFAEPVVYTSVLPYLPEMMESVGVRKNEIAKWVGISSAVVAGCQCIMAVPWGTFSDRFGRKYTILLGLTSTMIFSLVFGFSQSLTMLLVSRAFIGLGNANVGIIRTMVAELVREKELQPLAFSMMPLVWSIGSIFGPAFGGALANPAVKHPEIFGNWEIFRKYPFALPNIISAILFIIGITTGFLFLEETLESRKHKRDYGLILGRLLTQSCSSRRSHPYQHDHHDSTVNERTGLLISDEESRNSSSHEGDNTSKAPTYGTANTINDDNPDYDIVEPKKDASSKFKTIFTWQSTLTLMVYGMLAMHSMGFDSLFPVFLHHPKQDLVNNPDVNLPFQFTSGFGLGSQKIGILYTLNGATGIFVQFVFFPMAARRWGVLRCFKVVAICFPFIYFITPFLVLIPESISMIVIYLLLMIKMTLGMFAFPCTTILLTNTASSLKTLGTLNGVGVSVSAIGRAAGPALVGEAFTAGVKAGYMIVPWWILTALTVISAIPVFWIEEKDGFTPDEEDDNDGDE